MNSVIAVLLLSVLMNAVSQLSLKRGIMDLQGINSGSLTRSGVFIRILKNPYIVIWIVLLAPSILLWLKAISMTELSFAYPFLSLSFVLIALGSVVFLKEHITIYQWVAIFLIVLGIILISGS